MTVAAESIAGSDELVRLFHGTTAQRAESILRDGWVDLDIQHEVDQLAAQYDVSSDEIWRRATERFTYVASTGRTGWVSFALGFDPVSTHWAQKAPEHRWELLELVWLAQRPELRWAEFSDEGRGWRLAEFATDDPVVIEVQIPMSQLSLGGSKSREAPPLTPELLELSMNGGQHADIRARVPLGPECIVATHDVERLVDVTTSAAYLGLDVPELFARSDAGELGEVVDCGTIWGTKWRWSALQAARHSDIDDLRSGSV